MRNDFETPKDARRYHTYHSTRKVWSYETRRKNQRVARTMLSDNHSTKRGYQPIREEGRVRRVQTNKGEQMKERINLIIMGIGFLAMWFGLGSIENPDYSINYYGAVIALVGGVVVFITNLYQERRDK